MRRSGASTSWGSAALRKPWERVKPARGMGRGSVPFDSPEFLNRANNTVLASLKGMLAQEFLSFVWPDLPRNQAVFAPIKLRTDKRSALHCSPDAPNAQSMMTFFPSFTAVQIAVPKFLYSAGHRATDVIAGWYNMIVTFIYGGVNQYGELVGNVCADLNGMGGAARWNRDGEHSIAPIFAPMADIGEQELIEEEVPLIKIVPHRLMRDANGFGKFRGGHGYQQIATMKDSSMWGFMCCSIGSKFPTTMGIFGGYAPGCYPLCKVRGVNVFEEMEDNRDLLRADGVGAKVGDLDRVMGDAYPELRSATQGPGRAGRSSMAA